MFHFPVCNRNWRASAMHPIDLSCGFVLMAFQDLFMGKNAPQPNSQHAIDVYQRDRKRLKCDSPLLV